MFQGEASAVDDAHGEQQVGVDQAGDDDGKQSQRARSRPRENERDTERLNNSEQTLNGERHRVIRADEIANVGHVQRCLANHRPVKDVHMIRKPEAEEDQQVHRVRNRHVEQERVGRQVRTDRSCRRSQRSLTEDDDDEPIANATGDDHQGKVNVIEEEVQRIEIC